MGQPSNMKAFVCLSLLSLAAAVPTGPIFRAHHAPVVHHAVGAGQTSHQSVSTAHGEQRSLVQAKAFGATHASVSQVDNSKGLAEIQPAIAANKVVPVGKAAVVPVHSVAPVHHAVAHHAPVVAPLHHAVHAAPVVAHAVHAAPAYAPAPVAYKPAPAYKLRLTLMRFPPTPSPTPLPMTTPSLTSTLRRPPMVPAMCRDHTLSLCPMAESRR